MKCSAKEVNIPLKRFENKRYVLLAVLVFLGLLVVAATTILVMIFLGWRFTYQPGLDNKWDAISAVAAWAGVVVAVASTTASFLAIWFAIRVPQKIAKQQDMIALFEKRYQCYATIQIFLTYAEQIKDCYINHQIQAACKMYFGKLETLYDDEAVAILALKINQKKALIVSGEFLFSNYHSEQLQAIIDTAMELIQSVATDTKEQAQAPLNEKSKQLKDKYCVLCDNYKDNYLDAIENEMTLVKQSQ